MEMRRFIFHSANLIALDNGTGGSYNITNRVYPGLKDEWGFGAQCQIPIREQGPGPREQE